MKVTCTLKETLRDWTTGFCFTCQGSLVTSDSEWVQVLHPRFGLTDSEAKTFQDSVQWVHDWDGERIKIW